ncbi:STAS domain-containing protein [Streptomyces sp. NBC_00876]|uniref:STAS domain-containing protein n=1 Tax=Streptomyces sp. NBC_00876 TaxID=2975853 RepID=UPI00386F00FB|nr:STAS domain-containing protein [Streptomyces sp. NBC_00876]
MDPLSPAALVLSGRVTRAVTPRLCADLEAILATSEAAVVDCDVGGILHPDLASVEAIARLSLVARRAGGRRLRLRGTPPELQLLLDLVGLDDVIDLAETPS